MTNSSTFTTPEAGDEDTGEDLGDLLLEVLPGDGSTIGNLSAREALSRAAERSISEEVYKIISEQWSREDLGNKIQAVVADVLIKNSGNQSGYTSK